MIEKNKNIFIVHFQSKPGENKNRGTHFLNPENIANSNERSTAVGLGRGLGEGPLVASQPRVLGEAEAHVDPATL